MPRRKGGFLGRVVVHFDISPGVHAGGDSVVTIYSGPLTGLLAVLSGI
ncbi:MAG: hypothetical protein MI923_28350 [Phycisphaerales bacterium]|nr:hypothetical protein [Phycisphaerales bacterium]